MKHLVFACGLAALLGSAQAATLFSNGPVVDASGLSILGTADTTLGAGSNASATLADNFSITGASWSVESLDFFGYQTGSTTFTVAGYDPRIGASQETFAVEPILYADYAPMGGEINIGIEEDVVITASGVERLHPRQDALLLIRPPQ